MKILATKIKRGDRIKLDFSKDVRQHLIFCNTKDGTFHVDEIIENYEDKYERVTKTVQDIIFLDRHEEATFCVLPDTYLELL